MMTLIRRLIWLLLDTLVAKWVESCPHEQRDVWPVHTDVNYCRRCGSVCVHPDVMWRRPYPLLFPKYPKRPPGLSDWPPRERMG